MKISVQMLDGARIVLPAGRLDSNTSPEFEKTLLKGLDQTGVRLVLDFSELDYISSAGLRVVLMAAKRVKHSSGKMALCALKENIREVFEISGFLNILMVYDDRNAALAQTA